MKTVQQYFNEVDSEKIIENYVYTYLKELINFNSNLSFSEFLDYHKTELNLLISRFKTIDISNDSEIWILFAHHRISDISDIEFSLVPKSALLSYTDVLTSYAFEFCNISEIAGFYIPDTYLNNFYIIDLLAYVLFEASFFGYQQEHLQTTYEKLINDSQYLSENLEELLEQSKETDYEDINQDLIPIEVRDSNELEAWNAYIKSEIAYNKVAYELEINKIKKLLEDLDNG